MGFLNTNQKQGLEDLLNGAEDVINGLADITKGTYKVQKPVSNWSMDKALRIASSGGYFLGLNALALIAVHFGYNDLVEPVIQEVFGNEGYNNFMDYMNNHLGLKNSLATLIYLPVLGMTNFGKIVPDFLKKKSNKIEDYDNEQFENSSNNFSKIGKKIKGLIKKYAAIPRSLELLKKEREPNLINYAKLTLYSGLILAATTIGGGLNTSSKMYKDLSNNSSFIEKVESLRDNLFLFGEQGNSIIESSSDRIVSILDEMNKDKKKISLEDSFELEDNLEFAKQTNSEFNYENDSLFQDLKPLITKGLFKSPELAIYTARVVYFEAMRYKGVNHNQLSSEKQQKTLEAMEDVVSCIYNRWMFNNMQEEKKGIRPFAYKNGTALEDIAFKHRGNVWEFTAVRDNPKYFHNHKGEGKWDIYEDNKLNVGVGDMDEGRAQTAMQAVINVLTGKTKDRTNQATFYQNPKFVDSKNKDWGKRYGLSKTGYAKHEHVFWKPKSQIDLSHYGQRNSDGVEIIAESNFVNTRKDFASSNPNITECYKFEDKGRYLKIRLDGSCTFNAEDLMQDIFSKYDEKTKFDGLKEHVGNYEYKFLSDDKNLKGYRTLFMAKM
jgi:hypothetical protein